MVEIEVDDNHSITTIVLTPDRSSSWRSNKRVIALLGGTCLAISFAFYFAFGIWMILPFAGLEIAAVSAGLYYAQWKLSYRHVIAIDDTSVTIEQGVYRPSKQWQFERFNTRLHIYPPKHEWEAKSLYLISRETKVRIGQFLSKSDTKKCIELLLPFINIVRENTPSDE